MKRIVVFVLLLSVSFLQAQNFEGKGDKKVQIGAHFQEHARGINVSYDLGLGENMSVGLSSTYILGVDGSVKPKFKDAFDLKARFNANIGSVLNIDENLPTIKEITYCSQFEVKKPDNLK